MLERFTRERQRASNGAFNLEDDVDLTHYGQSLSKLDDFDDVGFKLDSDEEDAKGSQSTPVCLPILTSLRSD
jgi:nucleolar protein 14